MEPTQKDYQTQFNQLSKHDKKKLWKYVKKNQTMPLSYWQRQAASWNAWTKTYKNYGPEDPMNKAIILGYISKHPEILQQYK